MTPANVATTLGRPTPDALDYDQWALWIEDTRMLIEARLGDLGELVPARLDYVVREAVAAKVRRTGDTATSVTVSVDDGSVTKRYDASPMSEADISEEWWALLSPEPVTSVSSTRPGFETDVVRWPVATPGGTEVWR